MSTCDTAFFCFLFESEDLYELFLCSVRLHLKFEYIIHILVPSVDYGTACLHLCGKLDTVLALVVTEELVTYVPYRIVGDE